MLLHASWEDVVFLHFLVEPRELRRRLPEPLRLDLPLGEAWLTLVALRSRGPAPLPPRLLRGVPGYSQLNLRTYVIGEGERAIYLFDQAVSSPTVAAAGRLLGVRQHSADLEVARHDDVIEVRLRGLEKASRRRPAEGLPADAELSLRVRIAGPTVSARRDLVGAALLERYVGYDGQPPRRTVIEHAPWVIQRLEVESLETRNLLPEGARLAAAQFGTPRVVAVGVPRDLGFAIAQPAPEPI